MIQHIDINGYWDVYFIYNKPLDKGVFGYTETDFSKRRTIVAIAAGQSIKEFVNTLAHEIKHVQSHICEYYKVKENSEKAAYLTGFIVQKVYDFLVNGG